MDKGSAAKSREMELSLRATPRFGAPTPPLPLARLAHPIVAPTGVARESMVIMPFAGAPEDDRVDIGEER
jgi:hypothetical protein